MPKHIHIGNVRLESRVLLAPMCGYTDLVFRLAVRRLGGMGLACTEMIDPKSVLRGGGRKREALLASDNEDTPLCHQIYGHDPGLMAEAALWLVENRNAIMIDINMGCPQRKIAGRGAGAGLLRNPGKAVILAKRLVDAAPVPVTVKLRLGLNATDTSVAARLAPELEQAGVAAITVHGRTLEQRFEGNPDLAAIRHVVESVRLIPVIGNGGIASLESAESMLAQTGCAGLMIGRAALKQPWIVRDIAFALDGQPVPPAPDRRTHIEFMLGHFDAFVRRNGERSGTIMFRRWIPRYAKAMRWERSRMVRLLRIDDAKLLRKEFCEDLKDPFSY